MHECHIPCYSSNDGYKNIYNQQMNEPTNQRQSQQKYCIKAPAAATTTRTTLAMAMATLATATGQRQHQQPPGTLGTRGTRHQTWPRTRIFGSTSKTHRWENALVKRSREGTFKENKKQSFEGIPRKGWLLIKELLFKYIIYLFREIGLKSKL